MPFINLDINTARDLLDDNGQDLLDELLKAFYGVQDLLNKELLKENNKP